MKTGLRRRDLFRGRTWDRLNAMVEPSEDRKWQRTIRAAVREACETWRIQAQAAPVTPKQLEEIINRAAVPILRSMPDAPLEVPGALLPTLVRVMLAAAIEVMAEERRGRHR